MSVQLLFNAMFITGVSIFLFLVLKRSKLMRVDWSKVGAFVGFMTLLTAIRFGLMTYSAPSSGGSLNQFSNFMLVFWEDSFFSIPIWFAKDYLKASKKVWIPLAILLSVTFAYFHLSYGVVWACITLSYPYFISYRYGSRNGYGTQIICHIIYDFMTLAAVKIFFVLGLLAQFGL